MRRGLDDGTQRLHGQLREAAQCDQRDDYGGDAIEHTADRGFRQMEHMAERLRPKQKKGKQTAGDSPEAESTQPGEKAPSGKESTAADRIKTHRPDVADSGAPPDVELHSRQNVVQQKRQAAVKTKEAYLKRQPTVVQVETPVSMEQGRRSFVEHRKRGILNRSRNAPPVPQEQPLTMDRTSYQKLSHPIYTESGTAPKQGLKKESRSPQNATGKRNIPPATKEKPRPIKTESPMAVQDPIHIGHPNRHRASGQVSTSLGVQTRQAIQRVQRQAQSKKAATTGRKATERASRAAGQALRSIVQAARDLAAATLAGSSFAIAIVVVILLAGILIVSPFGIFFAESDSAAGTLSPAQAVAQINGEFGDKLEELASGYDRMEIEGQPSPWSQVLAVFAVKAADAEDGNTVAVLDSKMVNQLRRVFWDMTKLTTSSRTIQHPASGDEQIWTETVLTITITARTPDDMRVFYSFTPAQNEALDELLKNELLLSQLAGDLSITDQSAKDLLARLPADLSPERRAVVQTACSLVGKVNYFWGGKSLVVGWDSRWGQLTKVWADGSSTTGTYRPFGLDCSGFADWVFYNASGGSYVIGHGGGAHAQHTHCTPITWNEAQPGDLVFYPDDVHVGIVGGRDDAGNLLIIHCASSANNVVITGLAGFVTIGRPSFFEGIK